MTWKGKTRFVNKQINESRWTTEKWIGNKGCYDLMWNPIFCRKEYYIVRIKDIGIYLEYDNSTYQVLYIKSTEPINKKITIISESLNKQFVIEKNQQVDIDLTEEEIFLLEDDVDEYKYLFKDDLEVRFEK
jgi:hypothetical protein